MLYNQVEGSTFCSRFVNGCIKEILPPCFVFELYLIGLQIFRYEAYTFPSFLSLSFLLVHTFHFYFTLLFLPFFIVLKQVNDICQKISVSYLQMLRYRTAKKARIAVLDSTQWVVLLIGCNTGITVFSLGLPKGERDDILTE